jgi:hypothetical protein
MFLLNLHMLFICPFVMKWYWICWVLIPFDLKAKPSTWDAHHTGLHHKACGHWPDASQWPDFGCGISRKASERLETS